MRLLLAGALATVTVAGLATIRPAVLTDEERSAARRVDASRIRADIRFLSSDLLEGRAPGSRGDRLAREYVSSRMEAIGLEPGAADGSWEHPVQPTRRESEGGHPGGADVVGRLAGRDPELRREAVLYTAHLGRGLDAAAGPAALLAVAEAFVALPGRPRRSILFAVVAEGEQGRPGAALLASAPPPAVSRVVAHVDLDGAGLSEHAPEGPEPGRSPLDAWIRTLADDRERSGAAAPALGEGACDPSSRSSFARARVPTACLGAGTDVEDLQLAFLLGAKVAEAPVAPAWTPADELERARLAADGPR